MRCSISPGNPYKYNRWGFAWEQVPVDTGAHLDFGCHDGQFLSSLESKQINRLVGVDVSEQAIQEGKERYPELEILQISPGAPIPFDDGSFTSATILDVIEHVSDQGQVLGELHRVMEVGGRLIVTVPGKHAFSFLDMGNLKFRFPGLHRWFYCRNHSQAEYEQRYVLGRDGLIGDISADKRWHEHFSRSKMGDLLEQAGFEVETFDGTGLFARIIGNLMHFLRWYRPLHNALGYLREWDAKLFASANLFCVATKRPAPREDQNM